MDELSLAHLLSQLRELKNLLRSREQDAKRADALAMSIARNAPNASIREFAMSIMSEADTLRRSDPSKRDLSRLLAVLEQLQAALEKIEGKPSQ